MTYTHEQLRAVVEQCEGFRGTVAPGGYRDGLALCIIDSIQSTGVRYSSVVKVVNSYRRYRESQKGSPDTDGADQLLQTFEELDGHEGWAAKIGNQNKVSTKPGAPLKASAIRDAARALAGEGVVTTRALRDVAEDTTRLKQVEAAWCAVPGQRSGITWHYVQMLAGTQGVKPDRMIVRFVADAIGLPRNRVTPDLALQIVKAAAEEMGVSPTNLDHGIWQWQRRRR